jgi:beta-1,4-mannooligosaccharide/beta-1,4-mannosyl-N-acetylglucosamine phosphorylase
MIKRCELNPILTAKNIPYDADLIFNAGVIKLDGEYIMLFRNDYLKDKSVLSFSTNLGIARSKDGIHFTPDPKPCFQMSSDEILEMKRKAHECALDNFLIEMYEEKMSTFLVKCK